MNSLIKFFEDRVQKCRDTLIVKAKEYATDDRLHNFMVSADFMGVSPEQACLSFMTKHLVSISDMCGDSTQGKSHTLEIWDEKIGDALNYLFLLSALVCRDAVYLGEIPDEEEKIIKGGQ